MSRRPALTPKRQESLQALLEFLSEHELPESARLGRNYIADLLEHESSPAVRMKRRNNNRRCRIKIAERRRNGEEV